jgi:hypothetical protein
MGEWKRPAQVQTLPQSTPAGCELVLPEESSPMASAERQGRALRSVCRTSKVCGIRVGSGDAFDDDAFCFEVRDAVVGAVAHHDRFLRRVMRGGGFENQRSLIDPSRRGCRWRRIWGRSGSSQRWNPPEDSLRTGSEPERMAAIRRFIVVRVSLEGRFHAGTCEGAATC